MEHRTGAGTEEDSVPIRVEVRDWNDPLEAVYIGRKFRASGGRVYCKSEFANPFRLRDSPNRDTCIGRFLTFLRSRRVTTRIASGVFQTVRSHVIAS